MAVPNRRALPAPKELQRLVEAYFEGAKGTPAADENGEPLRGKNGLPIMEGGYPLTMAGLACAVGLSRQELLSLEGDGEAHRILIRARARVEAYAEEALFESGTASGAKFALSNNCAGWEERRQEKGKSPADLTDSELEERIRHLEGKEAVGKEELPKAGRGKKPKVTPEAQ